MPTSKKYTLTYATTLKRDLKLIDRKYHSEIQQTLKEQLEYQAEVKTKNWKPLKEPAAFKAEWELRLGPDNRFRAFYAVQGDEVILLAFGEKHGNRLVIGGQEVKS